MNKRMRNRALRKVAEAVVVLAITIALLVVGRAAALEERGHEAIGGEYCALLTPLFWAAIKSFFRDIKEGLFIMKEDDHGH